jgi:hypothetical protein
MVVPMPIIMAVLVVTMVVLGELGLVTVRVTAVIDDDRDGKLVGLRNLLDRFPIVSTIRKPEVLALVAFPTGLNRDGIGRYAGQPEARRETRLEYRKFEDAFFRGDSLQLRSVDGARVRAMVISMEMGKVMAMTVPVPAVHPQIARHAEMANQPPKAMSARLETVSTMWPKRSAKATPASHTTNAMSSVERTCPMPA